MIVTPASHLCSIAKSVPAGRSSGSGCLTFIYGSYPIPDAGVSMCSLVILAVGIVWLLWLNAPRRDLGAIYFFLILPVTSFILLTGWSAIGLRPVDTVLWGGVLVTIVVAAVGIVCSLPLGILFLRSVDARGCRRCGCFQ